MSEPGTQASSFDFNHPTVVALLYLASFLVGITCLVGLVLAYVWKGQETTGWEASHYSYHIRTFWYAVVGAIISACLTIVLIGFIGFALIGVWMIARTILALLLAQKRQPVPKPEALLW